MIEDIEAIIYNENLVIQETTTSVIKDENDNIIGYKIGATLYTKDFLIKKNEELFKEAQNHICNKEDICL